MLGTTSVVSVDATLERDVVIVVCNPAYDSSKNKANAGSCSLSPPAPPPVLSDRAVKTLAHSIRRTTAAEAHDWTLIQKLYHPLTISEYY